VHLASALNMYKQHITCKESEMLFWLRNTICWRWIYWWCYWWCYWM